MYKLKVKDKTFTIPKENLKLLAYVQAMDRGVNVPLKNDKDAIEYLSSIGIEVEKSSYKTNERRSDE